MAPVYIKVLTEEFRSESESEMVFEMAPISRFTKLPC